MNREEKIDKLLEILKGANIEIIEKTALGKVIIDGAKVQDAYIYDELLEGGFMTTSEVRKFISFVEKTNCVLVSLDDVSGISLENCVLNTDNIYISKLWT